MSSTWKAPTWTAISAWKTAAASSWPRNREPGTGQQASITISKVPQNKAPLEKEADPKIAIPDTYRIVAGSFNKAVGSFTILCKDQTDDKKKNPTRPPRAKKNLRDRRAIHRQIDDQATRTRARKAVDPDDWDSIDRIKDKLDEKIADEYRKAVDAKTRRPVHSSGHRQHPGQKEEGPAAPTRCRFAVTRPWRQWSLLDWSDHIVKYGILAVGAMLLIGLFTRLACLAGSRVLC